MPTYCINVPTYYCVTFILVLVVSSFNCYYRTSKFNQLLDVWSARYVNVDQVKVYCNYKQYFRQKNHYVIIKKVRNDDEV